MTWDEFKEEWENDLSYIECRTSGSTGKPDIIRLPKAEVINSALRTNRFYKIDSSSHLFSCISPDYIGGKMMYVRAVVAHARFSCEIPSNRPLSRYIETPIDLISVVPSQLAYILEHQSSLPQIANILVGGSPIPHSLVKKAAESELNIYESYGMTETASHIAVRKIEWPIRNFRPMEGISISVDGSQRLQIDIDGWKKISTNDIAVIDSEGQFNILGRSDNVIISGGIKIHPEEVEAILSEIFDFPLMITSRRDEKWGEAVVMVAETDYEKYDMIMEGCRRLLPGYQIPKEIVFSKIPRTSNGKIKRKH